MCFPKNLQCAEDETTLVPLFSTWKADWVYRRCHQLGHHQPACWACKLSWYLCIVKICQLKKCKEETILNQKSFFPTSENKPDALPALLVATSGEQLIRISALWWKCIYFLHTLSWHRSLFQKSRETVGSFIRQSLREKEIARLSNCGWQLAFRHLCHTTILWQADSLHPEALPSFFYLKSSS